MQVLSNSSVLPSSPMFRARPSKMMIVSCYWLRGRRKRGRGARHPPRFWKSSAKKVVFLVSSGKKQISLL